MRRAVLGYDRSLGRRRMGEGSRRGRVVRDQDMDQPCACGPDDRGPLAGSRGDADHGAGLAQLVTGDAQQEPFVLERDGSPVNVEVARDNVAGCLRKVRRVARSSS